MFIQKYASDQIFQRIEPVWFSLTMKEARLLVEIITAIHQLTMELSPHFL